MPDLSRSQLLVYGAVAVALLLVGARAIRAGGEGGASYARPGTSRRGGAGGGRVGGASASRAAAPTSSST